MGAFVVVQECSVFLVRATANSMCCVLLATGVTKAGWSRIAFTISWFAEELMKIAVVLAITSSLRCCRILQLLCKALVLR